MYSKYIKYKNKYLELSNKLNIQKGGKISSDMSSKFDEILDFLRNAKFDEIKNELYNKIKNTDYCPVLLGEGAFGRAYIPEVNKTMEFNIGKIKLNLPIIIKETKNMENPEMYAEIDEIDKKLYINGIDNLTMEALILMFVRELWEKTVHLPLILGYGVCSKKKVVNKIITYRYGLDKLYEKDLTGTIYNDEPLWHKPRKEMTNKFSSRLGTLGELFTYIHINKNKDGTIDLPNGVKKCNIPKLFDYISISYLATHYLLTENNIFPSDMHAGNVFIHWLDDNSYYDNENIKDIKEIVYKINDKHYKIETYGFVIVLGDVGSFYIKIRKDVILLGQIWDVKTNYKLTERRFRPEYTNMDLIRYSINMMTFNEYKETIAYKILSDEPYASYPTHLWLEGTDISYLDKHKSTLELLSYYDKDYGIDKYKPSKDNILIKYP